MLERLTNSPTILQGKIALYIEGSPVREVIVKKENHMYWHLDTWPDKVPGLTYWLAYVACVYFDWHVLTFDFACILTPVLTFVLKPGMCSDMHCDICSDTCSSGIRSVWDVRRHVLWHHVLWCILACILTFVLALSLGCALTRALAPVLRCNYSDSHFDAHFGFKMLQEYFPTFILTHVCLTSSVDIVT